MNDVYFVCLTCKNYHDTEAGWCRRYLEHPGIVQLGEPVWVESVLQEENYCTVKTLDGQQPQVQQWRNRVVESARMFLEAHRSHDISFDWLENFLDISDTEQFEWLDESLVEHADRSPRYFVERLEFHEWKQVVEHLAPGGVFREPLWWESPELKAAAKRKFAELIQRQNTENINLPTIQSHKETPAYE